MNERDIKKVINQFKNTSRLAFKAGYDGVEIHIWLMDILYINSVHQYQI